MTKVVSEVNFMPLESPVGEFNLSRLERVIYGPGKIAVLKDEMERRDLHRGLVVTPAVWPSFRSSKRSPGRSVRGAPACSPGW
jgi:hypothetical protein